MIRWIATVAIATALLQGTSFAAQPNRPQGFQACQGITFYSADEDPAGLNIRSGPGSRFPVLGRTKWRHLDMTAFQVLASQDGWFKVKAIGEWGYREARLKPLRSYNGIGWVAGNKLTIGYFAGETFKLFSTPGGRQSETVSVELEISGPQRIIGCQGNWVLIEHDETISIEPEREITKSGWVRGSCPPPGRRCPFRPSTGTESE